MIHSVTPNGVEHQCPQRHAKPVTVVIHSVTPNGVEHTDEQKEEYLTACDSFGNA